MGFQSNIVEKALANVGYQCEACGRYWHDLSANSKLAPLHGHSATTFHAVRDEKTGIYYATSVPEGHERKLGKPIPPNAFLIQELERANDLYILCCDCHLFVHDIAKNLKKEFSTVGYGRNANLIYEIARDITKTPYVMGNNKNDVPHILEVVTISFVLNGGQWIS